MTTATQDSCPNAYGVTYATFKGEQLQIESEVAIQMDDGSMLTLKTPTPSTERVAILDLLYA